MNYLFYLYCVIIVVMRILKLFSAAFLLSLFFSCSNPAQVSSVRTAETLRTVSDSMAQNVVWSEELQGDFLKQKIIGADGVSKSVKTTPYSAAVSSDRQKYPPLPPYIRGFASLDTSLYDTQALETLNAFCSALVSGEGADSFMAEGDVYSLVMFRYDLARLFEEKAGLALNHGDMFGKEGEGFMRMNVGCPIAIIEKAMNMLKKAVDEL